jgi:hypothetical protein
MNISSPQKKPYSQIGKEGGISLHYEANGQLEDQWKLLKNYYELTDKLFNIFAASTEYLSIISNKLESFHTKFT